MTGQPASRKASMTALTRGTALVAAGTQYGDQCGLTNSSVMSMTSSAVWPGSMSICACAST
jgi:hypothetical protein